LQDVPQLIRDPESRRDSVIGRPLARSFWFRGYGFGFWHTFQYISYSDRLLVLIAAGFSFQQPEGIYRSRPNEAVIADFEAEAEKK
jgi:hypothetical protein